MNSLILLLLLILLIGLSIYARIHNYLTLTTTSIDHKIETKSSPLSTAVQELVATAGGVYLSLIMLISFLKLEIPDRVMLGIVALDPIALLSIGLAIVQPLVTRIFLKG